jgi:hypothetical protein
MRLNDPRWKTLEGGYRIPYDPSHDLAALGSGQEAAMERLWEGLHHQGDVGTASYAAVPALVEIYSSRPRDWNFYGLVNVIELCRLGVGSRSNPPLPGWLEVEYKAALGQLLELALQDIQTANASGEYDARETFKQILAIIAIGKNAPEIGNILSQFTEDEIVDLNAGKFDWT